MQTSGSFVAQPHYRINSAGIASREERGQQADNQQERGHGDEG